MPKSSSVRPDCQVQAIVFLQKLGFEFVPQDRALLERDGNTAQAFLVQTFRRQFKQLNRAELTGIKPDQVDGKIDRLLGEFGCTEEEEWQSLAKRFQRLLQSRPVRSPRAILNDPSEAWRFVDWQNVKENRFQVAADFSVEPVMGAARYSADLTLFLNGIPVAVATVAHDDAGPPTGIESRFGPNRLLPIPPVLKVPIQLQFVLSHDRVYFSAIGERPLEWLSWDGDGRADEALQALILQTPDRDAHLTLFRTRFAPLREEFERRAWLENDSTPLEAFLWNHCRPDRLLERLRYGVVLDPSSSRLRLASDPQVRLVRQVLESQGRVRRRPQERIPMIRYLDLPDRPLSLRYLGRGLALEGDSVGQLVVLVTAGKSSRQVFSDSLSREGYQAVHAETLERFIELLTDRSVPFLTVSHSVVLRYRVEHRSHEPVGGEFFVMIEGRAEPPLRRILLALERVFPQSPAVVLVEWQFTKNENLSLPKNVREVTGENPVTLLMREGLVLPVGIETAPLEKDWFEDDDPERFVSQRIADAWLRFKRADPPGAPAVCGRDDLALKQCAWNVSRHLDTLSGNMETCALLVVPSASAARSLHAFFQAIDLIESICLPANDGEISKEYSMGIVDEGQSGLFGCAKLIVVERGHLSDAGLPPVGIVYYLGDESGFPIQEILRVVCRNAPGKRLGLVIHLAGESVGIDDSDRLLRSARRRVGNQFPESALVAVDSSDRLVAEHHCKLWALLGEAVGRRDVEAEKRLMEPSVWYEFVELLKEFSAALWRCFASPRWVSMTAHDSITGLCRDLYWFRQLRKRVALRRNSGSRWIGSELRFTSVLGDGFRLPRESRSSVGKESLSREQLDPDLRAMISDRARAELVVNRVRACLLSRLDDAPFFCRRMIDRAEDLAARHREQESDAVQFLNDAMSLLGDYTRNESLEVVEGENDSELLRALKDAVRRTLVSPPRVSKPIRDWKLAEPSAGYHVSVDPVAVLERDVTEIALGVLDRVSRLEIVNWANNRDVLNRMRNEIDDFLVAWARDHGVAVSSAKVEAIIESVLETCREKLSGASAG